MQFTYVGHASGIIEHNGKRLLFDPWLEGPVYWGAWWHFPKPVFDASIYNVDYIYISHWHFDHMHAESLQKFNKSAHILLPKFPVSGLPEPLAQMGFSKITELANQQTFELAPGFRLTSYQVQLQDDSTAIVACDVPDRADPVVVVNLNDSKPLPSTWKRIRRQFPKVEILLRSYSPAWSYPTAYSFENPSDAIPLSKQTYKSTFCAAVEQLQPKFAVPFASGICHLTDDTLFENANLVQPSELAAYWKSNPLAADSDLHFMIPGSSYSVEHGFSSQAMPPEDIAAFVQAERAAQNGRLTQCEREIDSKVLNRKIFDTYFRTLRRRSWPLWLVMKACWQFDIRGASGTRSLWYDFNRNRTFEQFPDSSVTARFTIREGILAEALETMVFSNIDVAKRWKVWLAKGQVTKYFLINTFSGLNEAGYLRLRNLVNLRLWWGLFRRRDELLDYTKMALRMIFKGKEAALSTTVTTTERP